VLIEVDWFQVTYWLSHPIYIETILANALHLQVRAHELTSRLVNVLVAYLGHEKYKVFRVFKLMPAHAQATIQYTV
jgi:hypothetical protein